MTRPLHTRPDGLVDGTLIPWDALRPSGPDCDHQPRRVLPHRDGCDDVYECAVRGCDARWTVQGRTKTLAERAADLCAVMQATSVSVEDLADVGDVVRDAFTAEHDLPRPIVTVPDPTPGPSGLLARFRNRTRKARP